MQIDWLMQWQLPLDGQLHAMREAEWLGSQIVLFKELEPCDTRPLKLKLGCTESNRFFLQTSAAVDTMHAQHDIAEREEAIIMIAVFHNDKVSITPVFPDPRLVLMLKT